MKVTEHLKKATSPFVSFEILPPLKGNSIESIYKILDPLMEFNPPFINVTYHRSEYKYKRKKDGSFDKVYIRKRPGTVGICAAIMNKYKVDAVPHLTCGGFTVEETEDALVDLNFLNVNNVLLVRGDPAKTESHFMPEERGHKYAVDLVKQVVNMNNGKYLEDDLIGGSKTDFCIGVAGYPEKHYESPNMKTDLKFLKDKVNAGADYIVTQMFFDNSKYFAFVDACRKAGIKIPIIPGLKPLTTKNHIHVLPRIFSVDIPEDLSDAVEKCKDNDEARQIGIEWSINQSRELIKNGAPCLHYYTMGNVETMTKVVQGVV